MTRREVEEKFPDEAAEWEKDPYTFAPVGGESGLAVTARALRAHRTGAQASGREHPRRFA
jgi:broad specificity phosphatase PhoE